jgi:hypothetical protein
MSRLYVAQRIRGGFITHRRSPFFRITSFPISFEALREEEKLWGGAAEVQHVN